MKRFNSMATVPKRLKIGLVLDTSLDTNEGVPRYVIDIGEWLRGQGHDVHYLVGQTDTRQLPNIHSLSRNIGVRFNGTRTTIPLPANRRKLQRFVRQQKFDVLHVQTPHHPLMAQHLIKAAGPQTAVIGTFHVLPYGRLSRFGNKALGLWLRPSLKRFDRMLAVSPAAAEYCRWSFGLTAEVLPNVVDYKQFRNAKPLPRYDDEKPTILFLGRLVPRKGPMKLLQAAALLAARTDIKPFRVVICGSGPLQPKLEAFITKHNLSDTVELAGFVSEADKPRYYASADIAAFPSRGGESFGIVLLEAMAGGHAVVLAGDNPGYRSVMAPQPDLLFDAGDEQLLADKLAYYLNNTAAARKLRLWGRAYAADFDTAVVGTKLLGIYEAALRKRRSLR